MKGIAHAGVFLLAWLMMTGGLEAQTGGNSDVCYISPVPGSSLNMPGTNIIIRSTEPIDEATLRSSNAVTVTGTKSGVHYGRLVLADDSKTAVFLPDVPFTEGEQVSVNVGDGVKLMSGAAIAPLNFGFAVTPRVVKVPLSQQISEGPAPLSSYYVPVAATFGVKDSILPANFPNLTVMTDSTTAPGYLFISNFGWTSDVTSAPYLMIVDNSAHPIFYRALEGSSTDFNLQPNGHLTYFDRIALTFYELDSSYATVNSYTCGNEYATDQHELRILPNGHVLLMGDDYQIVDMSKIVPGGDSAATVAGLIIQELDTKRNVVFQWRSWDHFLITDATHEDLTASTIDYDHGNSLELDGDGNIILSNRHMDEITKINRTTGDIIWRMGGKNNQFTFINDSIGYSHQHAVRRLPNGDFTVFDNGNYHTPPFSRAIEYKVDEVNRTATLVWQFRNTPDQFSLAMGYVQRLPNGNTLIGWGDSSPAVTEVTSDGKKVFEMALPDQVVSYRAYRYPWNVGTSTADVVPKSGSVVPAVMTLNENYPNPFNPSTMISFSLPASGFATLKVYNVLGQEVATLVNGTVKGGEVQTVSFDGSALASGVYYCRLESGQKAETRKMLLLK